MRIFVPTRNGFHSYQFLNFQIVNLPSARQLLRFLLLIVGLILFYFFPNKIYSNTSTFSNCPTTSRIYVNQNVITSGDGTSWSNAYAALRDALDMAQDCPDITEIWIAKGTYKPSAGTNRFDFFIMRNHLSIYGGFDGTETQLSERDWRLNETILSGDLLGDDDYSTLPVTGNEENSFHVIFNFLNDLDSTAVLDGIHLVGGNANSGPPNHIGGGLYNKQASPTIRNCKIYYNHAGYGGGGNYNDISTLRIENCEFFANEGSFRGGAMYTDNSTPKIYNCTFYNNHAYFDTVGVGGAIFNNFSSPEVINCTFYKNSATNLGGAINNNSFSKPKYYNSIFWENGDEIANTSTDPNGGDPAPNTNNEPTFRHCLIRNSNGSGADWNIFYGIDGGNNIDADPLFVDTLLGDLHLEDCSPAIDTGSNVLVPDELTFDLDGNARIFQINDTGVVDMGVYEFSLPILCCIVGETCDDGDPCTAGETLQADCNCGGGTLVDDDNDDLCDSDPLDNCIGLNIGDACDDGNPATTNDMINADCECDGLVNVENLDNKAATFRIFPNPVSAYLFLEIKNAKGAGQVKIYNSTGQLLQWRKVNLAGVSNLTFDTNNYSSGIYFIQIQLEHQQMMSQRFVVE
ncbi:MAG: T9SS type A sorting domain-containing protein [Bacteroidota bacterium]